MFLNIERGIIVTATVISFSLQKGGVGKTTTSTLAAFLLSQKGYRVLAIDMDSQANMTQVLSDSDDVKQFKGTTIREAMLDRENFKSYIRIVNDHLHYVPADDYVVLLSDYQGEVPRDELLIAALVNVLDEYDFVIIDTPPNLGTQTLNALMASDHVVVMFETAKYAYNAIDRFLETINSVRKYGNEELNILGILATLSDARRNDNKELLELVKEEYGDLVFNTVIPRRAAIGRVPVYGLYDNPELKAATEHHAKFIEEVLTRVN